MRFLIDECLSIDLVSIATQAGHDAQHVARVGKAGWKDWNVARHAAEGDFIVVTNNASDFRRLYAVQPLHAGLVIIIPSVNRVEQRRLFFGALDELARVGEPVNRVLEVDIEGDEAWITAPRERRPNRRFEASRANRRGLMPSGAVWCRKARSCCASARRKCRVRNRRGCGGACSPG
jgi:predicted nuclease of predicted toxin-antitoxin system